MRQNCRGGKHRYESLGSAGAGLARKKCSECGAVMIDLTADLDSEVLIGERGGLFAPRRPTLFSVDAGVDGGGERPEPVRRHRRR